MSVFLIYGLLAFKIIPKMNYFFEYNWQIRNEWFALCKTMPNEELYKERNGGLKSFAHTLFHIIKVENDWICDLQEQPILEEDFIGFQNFDDIIQLSKALRIHIQSFLQTWSPEEEKKILNIDCGNGNVILCTYGEALRHIIVHEIHHIGQLSIWARDIGMESVNSNFIHRGIIMDNKN